jgi:aryl-alcohol dehydrogenase-like predicted oxidoreductase
MGAGSWGRSDDDESIRTLHQALDLGINHFDTAPAYGGGRSEEVVGRGLEGRRSNVILATKVGASPERIEESLSASMRRLSTDYIDICYVHWPKRSVPLARTMETLESLRSSGRIRAIGVSNFTVEMIEMASRHGTVDVVQPPYNLIWRFPEEDVLPYCREHGIGVVAYSSLAQGLLTGTLRLNTAFAGDDQRLRSVLWQPENYAKSLYAVERLRPIAASAGISLAQLALLWLTSRPGVTSALAGARTPEEIAENASALETGLSPDQWREIRDISDEIYVSMPYYYDMWGNWRTFNRRGEQREL